MSDVRQILHAALGRGGCPERICDVDLSGGVELADAVLVLRRVVDDRVLLACRREASSQELDN